MVEEVEVAARHLDVVGVVVDRRAATMDEKKLDSFGAQSPMGRAAQPVELAPFFVFLASQESAYMTSEVLGVTGGSPIT
jgi:NAD(P)-dependent dehydrogenase (short-subunit alcohol dehydrogenase family)